MIQNIESSTEIKNFDEVIFIKKGKNLKKVLLSDIIYIEVENRYCNFVTSSEKFLIQISMNKLLPHLDENKFIRTHRNYIANINKIKEITLSENVIIMQGDYHITLSDKYKTFLLNYKIF
jgi:two-component system, LytTR family, response regulator